MPATLAPYPVRTLLDFVADAAAARPGHPALLFKGSTLSYGALERLSDACAAAFTALGVGRGDRVALLLPNCPQFFIVELGAWKIGAIVAPLNPIYTDAEIEEALRESGATAIVTLTRYYQRVKRLQARTPVRQVIATNIKDHFPPVLKAALHAGSREEGRRPRRARRGRSRFRRAAAASRAGRRDAARRSRPTTRRCC